MKKNIMLLVLIGLLISQATPLSETDEKSSSSSNSWGTWTQVKKLSY